MGFFPIPFFSLLAMRKRDNITICDYVAMKCPNEAFELIKKSGHSYDTPKNKVELAILLKKWVALDKDEALKQIAQIHPDRELIESLDREVKDSDFKGEQTSQMFGQGYANPFQGHQYVMYPPHYHSANGCSCGYHGADGTKSTSNTDTTTKLVLGLAFFTLIWTLYSKK
jgi:hypothetical protein